MRTEFALLLCLAAFGADASDRFRNRTDRCRDGNCTFAFFEFAPASGAGMGTECAGTIPTGARGEVVTFARASAATCMKADGTGVDLTTNQPAVQVCDGCSSGPLGIIAEYASTQLLLRSYALDNAAWTATAAVTADAFTGPFSGASRALEQLNDSSGAALQGVTQAVTTAVLQRYALTCWLRSGTATTAQLVITGTGNAAGDRTCNITGLTTSPRRFGCISTAAYAAGLTAVTASVLVGNVVADTGTIGAGDCQLEADTSGFTTFFAPSSYMPTTAAAATRAVTGWGTATPPGLTNTVGCSAVSIQKKQYDTETPTAFFTLAWSTQGYSTRAYTLPTNGIGYDGVNTAQANAGTSIIGATVKYELEWAGNTLTARQGAAVGTNAYDGTIIGPITAFGGTDNGGGSTGALVWLTNIIISSDVTRCR